MGIARRFAKHVRHISTATNPQGPLAALQRRDVYNHNIVRFSAGMNCNVVATIGGSNDHDVKPRGSDRTWRLIHC